MLASYPASILNHIPPRSGIPFDSFKTGNALRRNGNAGSDQSSQIFRLDYAGEFSADETQQVAKIGTEPVLADAPNA